jgi:hypothetical protein
LTREKIDGFARCARRRIVCSFCVREESGTLEFVERIVGGDERFAKRSARGDG